MRALVRTACPQRSFADGASFYPLSPEGQIRRLAWSNRTRIDWKLTSGRGSTEGAGGKLKNGRHLFPCHFEPFHDLVNGRPGPTRRFACRGYFPQRTPLLAPGRDRIRQPMPDKERMPPEPEATRWPRGRSRQTQNHNVFTIIFPVD